MADLQVSKVVKDQRDKYLVHMHLCKCVGNLNYEERLLLILPQTVGKRQEHAVF